jgi:hypothetical protein
LAISCINGCSILRDIIVDLNVFWDAFLCWGHRLLGFVGFCWLSVVVFVMVWGLVAGSLVGGGFLLAGYKIVGIIAGIVRAIRFFKWDWIDQLDGQVFLAD